MGLQKNVRVEILTAFYSECFVSWNLS